MFKYLAKKEADALRHAWADWQPTRVMTFQASTDAYSSLSHRGLGMHSCAITQNGMWCHSWMSQETRVIFVSAECCTQDSTWLYMKKQLRVLLLIERVPLYTANSSHSLLLMGQLTPSTIKGSTNWSVSYFMQCYLISCWDHNGIRKIILNFCLSPKNELSRNIWMTHMDSVAWQHFLGIKFCNKHKKCKNCENLVLQKLPHIQYH